MNNAFKIAMLGDCGVGKTALTIQFCLNHFIETYDPTIEDSYRKQLIVDHVPCTLEILDTAGKEDYAALREQWIRDSEGFVLVYSVTSRPSFNKLPSLLSAVERIKQRQVPIIVIGNKSDRVSERQVPSAEGAAFAKSLKCEFYEVSAKNNINLERALYEMIRITKRFRLNPSPPAPISTPITPKSTFKPAKRTSTSTTVKTARSSTTTATKSSDKCAIV